MADLIQEFFKRDMTESELDSLGRILETSSNDVLRFETQLEAHYLVTMGLPKPTLPKALHALPKAGGLDGMLGGGSAGLKILAVIVLTGGGAALWKYWPVSPTPPAQPALTSPAPVVQPMAPKTVPKAALKPALSLPPSLPAGPQGEELSVVVDSVQPTLVTVRILNESGGEIRVLFAGIVHPGHQSFQWDGLLANGQPAPPGNYQIDVQSGSQHQAKAIRIKP